MDIIFDNSKLRKLCTDSKKASTKWGSDVAKVLRRRLDDLQDAETLEEFRFLPGKCEELTGDRKGQLSLRLSGGARLVFIPEHEPLPAKHDGGLDWPRVSAIRILEVIDYHG